MDAQLIILLLGFSYAFLFAVMGIIRGEGFSMHFTLEGVLITLIVAAGDFFTPSDVHPILFLVFLYLFTMRSRLLVDLANLLSNRGRQRNAIAVLQSALRLYPDKQTRLIIYVNMGIVQLRRKSPQSAQQIFETVLEEAKDGGLGIRHRAAVHYNLAVALQKQGKEAPAVKHFREAADGYPGSPFSKAAQKALERRGNRKSG